MDDFAPPAFLPPRCLRRETRGNSLALKLRILSTLGAITPTIERTHHVGMD